MCSTVWFVLLSLVNLIQVQSSQQGQHSMLTHLASNAYSDDVRYCRIPMSDIISTAESTATRVLQGICNPRELNERFKTLENQIFDQFNVIKTMVLNIEDKLRDQDQKVNGQHRKLHRALMAGFRNLRRNSGVAKKSFAENKLPGSSDSYGTQENSVYDYYGEESDSFIDDDFEEDTPSPRESEMARYNSTIHINNEKRIFTYYWTIRDIPYRMKNWGWRRSLRSESFYIFQYGYRMYMRVYPNQNGKNIYIHVGITKGDYDAALDWPFTLKHKIQVVDHDVPGEDMSSRIWDPTQLCSGWNWRKPDSSGDNYECVGLGFPQETVYSRHYLHNNSVTIKLTVFLD